MSHVEIFCKPRWLCHKFSIKVVLQVETLSYSTLPVVRHALWSHGRSHYTVTDIRVDVERQTFLV